MLAVFAENSESLDIPRVADIQSPSRFYSLSLSLPAVFFRHFGGRSRPNTNVPFDRVARTRNVTCAGNMCPLSLALSPFLRPYRHLVSRSLPLRLPGNDFSSFLRFNRTGALKTPGRHAYFSARMRFRVSAHADVFPRSAATGESRSTLTHRGWRG